MPKILNNVILLCVIISVVLAEKNIEQLVDAYENWYNERSEDAANYVPPTDARMYEASDTTIKEFGKYDYIVIGAGTTGSVVASRLSEDPERSVLLLEAGSYTDEDFTRVPGWFSLNLNSKYNWNFRSIPQTTAFLGAQNRISDYPRGKGIGGSSLINTLHYTRCNRKDYDKWADLLSDPSWNYSNLLPYFIKSEKFTRRNPYLPIDTLYHGYHGPLRTSQAYPHLNFVTTILRGTTELGYNITDYNGRNQLGASIFQYFTKNGLRFDNGMAYILPVKYRKNLKILESSYVTKIEIGERSKEVRGVVFTRDNKTYVARARKEVILSAGAISSPQILMLSGVGPREHLESLGIPVIKNLPVGNNFLDHTRTVLAFSSNASIESQTFRESIRNLLYGQGPLTRTLLTDAVAFFQTPVERTPDYPDVEFFFSNFSSTGPSGRPSFSLTPETANGIVGNATVSFAIVPYILHQKSTGTIRLKSSNPFDYPLIDPNLFTDKGNRDLETLYQGVQIILRLLETPTFRSINARLAATQLPGCEETVSLSREYWYCYFRRVTILLYHGMGTCSTGTGPKSGVVDNSLRVFGIKKLRVADASVIPFALTGHTNAPCTVIGEKVSDLIKQAH